MVMEQEPFDIEVLMHGVSSLVEAQIEKDGLTHHRHRENIQHTALVGSSLKLRQIMVNLFSNAIKYNKPGGAIDTYAKELSCDGTTVWYEFRITDTGIGMSRDFVENQLFKPFIQESADARTQYRGTGLGMSIVKDLVSQMGGSISAESQLGEGTAFTFQLPFLLDKNTAAKPQPSPPTTGGWTGCTSCWWRTTTSTWKWPSSNSPVRAQRWTRHGTAGKPWSALPPVRRACIRPSSWM